MVLFYKTNVRKNTGTKVGELKNITQKLNSALHGIKPSEDKKPLEGAFNLIIGIDDPPSYYVFYTLLVGYQLQGYDAGEKSTWGTKIIYKGVQYVIRDWKRSTWSIETNDKSEKAKVFAEELRRKIETACKIFFKEIEKDFKILIKKNEIYIPNNAYKLKSIVEFYNKEITEHLEKYDSTIKCAKEIGDKLNAICKQDRELLNRTVASIAFFFSFIEFVLDACYAFKKGRDILYVEFRRKKFKDRFKSHLSA